MPEETELSEEGVPLDEADPDEEAGASAEEVLPEEAAVPEKTALSEGAELSEVAEGAWPEAGALLVPEEVGRLAAKLQMPYLVWVTFAGYLNLGVWLLNG